MIVRCLYNTEDSLRKFEYNQITYKNVFGRFGVSGYSEYNCLEIGKEYLVMGIIIFETYQAYLIDDNGFISACPCQLFELINDKINADWHFRLIDNDEDIYPFIQAIFGYPELCSDKKAYENLIVEKEEYAQRIYFRRKIELEQILKEQSSLRTLTSQEERLLEVLVKKSSLVIPKDWKNGLLVRPMDDGGMGSLSLFPQGNIIEDRISGELVSDFQFTDIDGIEVIASLYVDSDGNLFELDIWKTDFGKLIKLPDL